MEAGSDKTIHKDYRIKLLPEHTTDMSRCIILKTPVMGPVGRRGEKIKIYNWVEDVKLNCERS
jgi:hypothetical protein